MHGPEEVALADDIFTRVEEILGLERYTVKIGIMDEERRTSANLAACIAAAAKHRHLLHQYRFPRPHRRRDLTPSMEAGTDGAAGGDEEGRLAHSPTRHAMSISGSPAGCRDGRRSARACGRRPTRMADMLAQKHSAHPQAGASCAWVPSTDRGGAACHALSRLSMWRRRQEEISPSGARRAAGDIARGAAHRPAAGAGPDINEEIEAELEQLLPGHPGLCRALGESRDRLFQGARYQRCRA